MTENTYKPKVHFYGGVGMVTGANFLLEIAGQRILIDCGLIQGSFEDMAMNYEPFPYDPSTIDILIVTHAHLDHFGRIPKLVKDGFHGRIYSTEPTKDISDIMMRDSVSHLADDAKKRDFKPLYEEKHVDQTLELWRTEDYHHTLPIVEGLTVSMFDAGHILGSSVVKFSYKGQNIVFTGDLGNSPSPLLRDTEVIDDADYLIMESVYGNRNHENKEGRTLRLQTMIEDAIAHGGTMMIPAFSVERTQEFLFEINNLVNEGRIPSVPIFLDSPLAIEVTEIYRRHTEYFKKDVRDQITSGDDIFDFPGLTFTPSVNESKAINNVDGPKIILAASGMSHGGRIIHHELRYLSGRENTLMFVGYQASGTLGRIIQDGARSVRIYKENIPVRARIEVLSGYSGHKQMDDLMEFVHHTKDRLKKVWCVMGEPAASMFLAQRLRDYVGVEAFVPEAGQVVELDIE